LTPKVRLVRRKRRDGGGGGGGVSIFGTQFLPDKKKRKRGRNCGVAVAV